MMMSPENKKNSSKTEVFWGRFEKSGSIKDYLKFHKARLKEELAQEEPKTLKPAKSKTR